MAANDGRLLGLYDEMSSFLGKLNLCRGKGICDSHELAVFLELYNANAWSRSTGIHVGMVHYVRMYMVFLYVLLYVGVHRCMHVCMYVCTYTSEGQ